VDYLLLSWLVAHYGIAPPCIAAGDNLRRIPVVGTIFRRSGNRNRVFKFQCARASLGKEEAMQTT
jgi:glycerol-3-phosphate O-acyltransferase